ncbi:MAG: hypothetical protein J6O23_07935 [Prevotella sp.]|nr:hypothetical protein [Prevotella sp.]
MKKREYIKPEIELLDSELQVILCVSVTPNPDKTTGGIDFDDTETEGQDVGTDTGGGTGGPV